MKKPVNEEELKTLDTEIALVQMENFANRFDNAMKKEIKRSLKNLLIVLPLVLMSIGIIIAFPNPVTLCVGIGIVAGTISISQIIENRKLFKKIDSQYVEDSHHDEEKSVEQILGEEIIKTKGKDYYTGEYKEAVERAKTESKSKYGEALERQKQARPNLKIAGSEQEFLDRDETEARIMREIDAYCVAYSLPPLKITDEDWDIFFGFLYKEFVDRGMEDRFYSSISEICRFTFAKALVGKKSTIKINDFISNICHIKREHCEPEISTKDILNMQKGILLNISKKKVVGFAEYADRKGGKK